MKYHWTHDPIRDVFYHWVKLEDRCERIGFMTRAVVEEACKALGLNYDIEIERWKAYNEHQKNC